MQYIAIGVGCLLALCILFYGILTVLKSVNDLLDGGKR